jgi:hypothetical protein
MPAMFCAGSLAVERRRSSKAPRREEGTRVSERAFSADTTMDSLGPPGARRQPSQNASSSSGLATLRRNDASPAEGGARRRGLRVSNVCQTRTVEREKGFEPSTSTLARLHSTTELLPQRQSVCGGNL